MQSQILKRFGSFAKGCQFYSLINPLRPKKSNLFQPLNLEMVTKSGSNKRPMCPSCSKPTWLCLCTRFKNPKLHNSVAVTILQHSMEKKHPLNSARIASIALKNLMVISVSDVQFQAQFVIRSFNSNLGINGMGVINSDETTRKCRDIIKRRHCNSGFECELDEFNQEDKVLNGCDEKAVGFTVEKYRKMGSLEECWAVENGLPRCDFDQVLDSIEGVDDLGKGFAVKKLQRKPIKGGYGIEENEEFELVVPPGSVLLFPSEKSVVVEALDFEVKNLIVLDGTWNKAKKMYKENPWLKLLPHLKLDIGMRSLYGEVRNQPKEGYLSTIESIVYALKAVGEDLKGLDDLLDVFASMVGDQRRCKDEKLSKLH